MAAQTNQPISINMQTNHLQLAVSHLNTPVGEVINTAQLAQALCAGSVDELQESPGVSALLRYLFVELEPRLIALCAYEAGTDVAHANMVYQENLRHAMPRVPAWENAVTYLL